MADQRGSILDSIFEKTANIEYNSNSSNIKETIADILRTSAHKELKLRESTITMKKDSDKDHEALTKAIEEWCSQRKQLSPTVWQDKDQSYFQFDATETKEAILCFLNGNSEFKGLVVKYGGDNEYFRRKPVRIIINNLRGDIKFERVVEILQTATGSSKAIIEAREGKPHPLTRSRAITFKVKAEDAHTLFVALDGELTYSTKEIPKRTKLLMKINVKPWQCKDCSKFGVHKCEGKKCTTCGASDHQAKDCKAKTKFCTNCKKRGHKAKDAHCSTYLNEIAKEIRKMDIPNSLLESASMRNRLAKFLQYK